jgi:TP53 regulating kinase-like protein
VIAKERFRKTYRIPELDQKLRRKQLAAETKALEKAIKAGVKVPEVVFVDKENSVIYLSELEGQTVRDYILSLGDLSEESNKKKVENIAFLIGKAISDLHMARVMHSDLTTSNMIVPSAPEDAAAEWMPDQLHLIDFGLSFFSDLVEDRSVDLYVLERAVQTTHENSDYLLHKVYNTYKNQNLLGNKVQTRLNDVRNRGRKKSMIG